VIRSFKCKETEKIFKRSYLKKYPVDMQRVALRKLRMLNRAEDLNDLRVPPGNRLEALKGKRMCLMLKSQIIIRRESMSKKKMLPLHPGEILLEEFLKPMGLSQNRMALDIRVPARRINEIVQGKRRITADTALRLARYFKMSPQFWLGLQIDFDLDVAEDKLADRLDKEIQVYSPV
jgi:addiction module HigA family antidote